MFGWRARAEVLPTDDEEEVAPLVGFNLLFVMSLRQAADGAKSS